MAFDMKTCTPQNVLRDFEEHGVPDNMEERVAYMLKRYKNPQFTRFEDPEVFNSLLDRYKPAIYAGLAHCYDRFIRYMQRSSDKA